MSGEADPGRLDAGGGDAGGGSGEARHPVEAPELGELDAGGAEAAGETAPQLPRGRVASLWRRIVLTWRYHGPWSVAFRIITFPLRATPLRYRLGVRRLIDPLNFQAQRWYRVHGEPVAVVIPSYRDADSVGCPGALDPGDHARASCVRIIVADDASGPEHLAALRAIAGIEIVEGERNAGFAANVNRGLRAAGEDSTSSC